jgi:hypothetical protein
MMNATSHNPDSAIEVLMNPINLELPIYPGKSEQVHEEETKLRLNPLDPPEERSSTKKKRKGSFLFADLVEHQMNVLEQILSHQQKQAGQNGKEIKMQLRERLEGWDFFDLVTDRDPRAHVATLNAMGYGWVDFVRSINAPILLGCEFGDMIKPVLYDRMCPGWHNLPTGKSYLAASMEDMANIVSEFGTSRTWPPQPVHGLVLHCPGSLMVHCEGQCLNRNLSGRFHEILNPHNDPVQVFYPHRMRNFVLGKPNMLRGTGAVVFGHNVSWKYHWRADGRSDYQENWHEPLEEPSNRAPLVSGLSNTGSSSSRQEMQSSSASRSTQSRRSGDQTSITSIDVNLGVDSSRSSGSGNNAPSVLYPNHGKQYKRRRQY